MSNEMQKHSYRELLEEWKTREIASGNAEENVRVIESKLLECLEEGWNGYLNLAQSGMHCWPGAELLQHLPNLRRLDISDNPHLKSVDISYAPNLKTLEVQNGRGLKSLDLGCKNPPNELDLQRPIENRATRRGKAAKKIQNIHQRTKRRNNYG